MEEDGGRVDCCRRTGLVHLRIPHGVRSPAARGRSVLRAVLVGVLCVSTLSACTDADNSAGVSIDQGEPSHVATAPAFQGPWSDWFTRIFEDPDTTPAQRVILADGVITDTEYADLRSSFSRCLDDLGVSVALDPDGGFSVRTDGKLSEAQVTADAVPGCEKKTVGSVAMLYEQIRRNPERKDESLIVVECFKRTHIVAGAYTVAQYDKDIADQTGVDWSSAEVRRCVQDPLSVASAP